MSAPVTCIELSLSSSRPTAQQKSLTAAGRAAKACRHSWGCHVQQRALLKDTSPRQMINMLGKRTYIIQICPWKASSCSLYVPAAAVTCRVHQQERKGACSAVARRRACSLPASSPLLSAGTRPYTLIWLLGLNDRQLSPLVPV